jgi:hypothetical protein
MKIQTVAGTEKKVLECMGLLVRIDHGRVVKKIFENKLEGRRRKGRPRWRWLEDVDKDLWEIKVKRWQWKAVNRQEWASVIDIFVPVCDFSRIDLHWRNARIRPWSDKKAVKLGSFASRTM